MNYIITLGIFVAGLVLLFLGSLVFGLRSLRAMRIGVCTVGLTSTALAYYIIENFKPHSNSVGISEIFGLVLGSSLLIIGLVFVLASIFGSSEKIETFFDTILKFL